MRYTLLVLSAAWLAGCTGRGVEHFTLEVDLPPNFELKSAANYRPATGESCTLPRRRGKRPERKVFFTEYQSVPSRVSYELPLTETVDGCPLVLRGIEFDIYALWGARSTDVGGDLAGIAVRDRVESDLPGKPESGILELKGQCQWLFRTVGMKHAIRKVLKCNSLDEEGNPQKSSAGGVVVRDQLVGATLRMAIGLTNIERPHMRDTWVRFPAGWKRCLGRSFDDPYGFCQGESPQFKPFQMPDGRECTIYPICTE